LNVSVVPTDGGLIVTDPIRKSIDTAAVQAPTSIRDAIDMEAPSVVAQTELTVPICVGDTVRNFREGEMGVGFSVKDKVAIVTGGSKGIGRAIALALADHGADVVTHTR
jgi:hypothetical protein